MLYLGSWESGEAEDFFAFGALLKNPFWVSKGFFEGPFKHPPYYGLRMKRRWTSLVDSGRDVELQSVGRSGDKKTD